MKLAYAIYIWGGTENVTLNPLKFTLNHFSKTISYKSRHLSAFLSFKQLKMLPINLLFLFKSYKYLKYKRKQW